MKIMIGKVYLVGAGPGDPELLTLKALRVLRSANAVLHDELVSPEVLKLVPHSARVYNVGKRCGAQHISQEKINTLLVGLASAGLQVVRLKGGDPLIFGRAGEEIDALREVNIDLEIVPGVTAALGAAASAQIPLTYRGISSSLVFFTGHLADGSDLNWTGLAQSAATLALYMPADDYSQIAQKLRSAGLSAGTPCAIVSRATTRKQHIHLTTIESLADSQRLPAPALLLIGEVVRLARHAVSPHSPVEVSADERAYADLFNLASTLPTQLDSTGEVQVPHV